jgi:hypothetical protein
VGSVKGPSRGPGVTGETRRIRSFACHGSNESSRPDLQVCGPRIIDYMVCRHSATPRRRWPRPGRRLIRWYRGRPAVLLSNAAFLKAAPPFAIKLHKGVCKLRLDSQITGPALRDAREDLLPRWPRQNPRQYFVALGEIPPSNDPGDIGRAEMILRCAVYLRRVLRIDPKAQYVELRGKMRDRFGFRPCLVVVDQVGPEMVVSYFIRSWLPSLA